MPPVQRRLSAVAYNLEAEDDEMHDSVAAACAPSAESIGRRCSGIHHVDRPVYAADMLSQLDRFRGQQTLCDVTLFGAQSPAPAGFVASSEFGTPSSSDVQTGPEILQSAVNPSTDRFCLGIKAHKCVLASVSDYFETLFTKDAFVDSQKNEFVIAEVGHAVLENLIQFVYTGEMHIDGSNVEDILSAASYLQLPQVVQMSGRYLEQQLSVANCLGIKSFAEAHGCGALRIAADRFILTKFTSLVVQEEFLQLSAKNIADIIRNDALTVATEDAVYDAVLRWINYDPSKRQQYVYDMMQHVRLALVSRRLLLQLSADAESAVHTDVRCKDLLIEALSYQLMQSQERRLLTNDNDLFLARMRPRVPSVRQKSTRILAVGGQAPKATQSFYCYEFSLNQWRTIQRLPARRCRAGAAVVGQTLYMVGGFNGSLRLREVDACNLVTGEWRSLPPLQQRRSTLGVAVLRDDIYAVGGFDGQQGLASVEKYSLLHDSWVNVAPMSTRRSSVGVAVIKNRLYAVGGFCGQNRVCLSTIESYDADHDRWAFVAPEMRQARSGAGVAALDECLYVVGGHDGPQVKRTMEVLNVETGQYIPAASLQYARRNCVALAIGNNLYVVGGDNGVDEMASIEVYDPRSNLWSADVVVSLPTPLSYSAMVAIHDDFELSDKF